MSKHSPVRVICPLTHGVLREIPVLDNPKAIAKVQDKTARTFLFKRRSSKKKLRALERKENGDLVANKITGDAWAGSVASGSDEDRNV